MTRTIDAKITLSDEQYEALQVIYRIEADSMDEYLSKAVVSAMEAHIRWYCPSEPIYKRLEAMIKA